MVERFSSFAMPPVHDHGGVLPFAHPLLQYLERVGHGGGVSTIAGKDFMRFGETIPVEHQPYNYLFAVGSGVARITALGFALHRHVAPDGTRRKVVEGGTYDTVRKNDRRDPA
jgi:hypothetical protein